MPHFLLTVYCVFIVAASLYGGWLPTMVRLTHTRMQTMVSFVGGLMLGIGLLHLLPHSEHVLESLDEAVGWMLAGIAGMFLLIRAFHVHHHGPLDDSQTYAAVAQLTEGTHAPDASSGHKHDAHRDHEHHAAHSLSWLGITFGLALHTLIDGIALGASIGAEAGHDVSLPALGTFLAILLHKPLDAISITSLMRAAGCSARRRNLVNAAFALMCPIGAVLFVLGVSQTGGYQQQIMGSALAFAAGVFVCISLADLLPEMEFHSHNRIRLTAALILGIALAWAITFLEPAHLHM